MTNPISYINHPSKTKSTMNTETRDKIVAFVITIEAWKRDAIGDINDFAAQLAKAFPDGENAEVFIITGENLNEHGIMINVLSEQFCDEEKLEALRSLNELKPNP
jgi:hypothetical protein